MPDDKIGFTVNEQNVLALLCEMMAKASHQVSTKFEFDDEAVTDSVCRAVDNFPSVNWGELYDKFHRQGKNA